MSGEPVVAVGCPIRNREWILPEYLGALATLDYPAARLRFGFIVNDCIDRTESALRAWERNPYIDVVNLGFPTWRREAGYSLHNLALLRNRLVDWMLTTDAHYLFSVDSDILVPPHSLKYLLADDKPVVAMLVNNSGADTLISDQRGRPANQSRPGHQRPPAYNILYWNEAGELLHFQDTYPRGALFEVGVTGAAYLIRRDVLAAGVRYAHHPMGEDVPFCQAAAAAGFRLWCDSRVAGRHIMHERRAGLPGSRRGRFPAR